MNLNEKLALYTQNKPKLVKRIVIVGFILLLIAVAIFAAKDFRAEFTTTLQKAEALITPRYWSINKITPDETNSSFTLNLTSNIGNVRNYSSVLSYGLSQDGQFLAVHNNDGVFIINLESENKVNIKTPVDKFAGDIGEAIDWNKDDKYFSLPVIVPTPKHTEVWIFTKAGELSQVISENIPVSETGKAQIEPVYFSHKTNYLLMRIYKQDDLDFISDGTVDYPIYQLPIYLVTYDIEGKKIEEITIRDYDTSGTNALYFWDAKEDFINYYIYKDTPPDITKDYLFTKELADHE